jgi:CDP-glycerol glycerophosphotransferase (TagB/SpsB family)
MTYFERFHVVEKIVEMANMVVIEARVSNQKFKQVDFFESTLTGKLFFECIGNDTHTTTYQVEIPKHKDRDEFEAFYAVLSTGKRERVWKPSHRLKSSTLPQGYGFTYKYLNLFYERNTKEHDKPFTPIVKSIQYFDRVLQLQGYLFVPNHFVYSINDFKVRLLKFRQEEIMFLLDGDLQPLAEEQTVFEYFYVKDFQKFNAVDIWKFEIQVPLISLIQHVGIYNLVFLFKGQPRFIQNYPTELREKEHIYFYCHKGHEAVFNFYYDDSGVVWKLDIYQMTHEEYLKLQKLQAVSERDKSLWLIGEYTISARDNGMHFYHYMLQNHSEIDVYYVIDPTSSDQEKLDPKNVVAYGSYFHFELAARAGALVFSHMAEYLIPKLNRITEYRGKQRAYFKAYLQHGVTGPTSDNALAHKQKRDYNFVNTTSQREAEIFRKYLGYDDEIAVNGFPRWDTLFRHTSLSHSILIIPTHRDYLWRVTEEEFVQSDYFLFWSKMLNNPRFIEYIESHKIQVHFFLHIILARFAKHFVPQSKQIVMANGDDIQQLLLTCGILMTDYSSVAFDALFQYKPVVYVPFDYDAMMRSRGGEPFIDYATELPGPICKTVDEALDAVEEIVERGWTLSDEYRKRRDCFFEYTDDHNSERVYRSIKKRLNVDI